MELLLRECVGSVAPVAGRCSAPCAAAGMVETLVRAGVDRASEAARAPA